MPIMISINAGEELSEPEKRVLRAILGDDTSAAAATGSTAGAKRGPGRPRKTAEAPSADPEPTDEGHTGSEPEEPTDATNDRDLKAIAVARATELVSQKKADVVKAALAKLGVKRVSELSKDEDLEKFLAELP